MKQYEFEHYNLPQQYDKWAYGQYEGRGGRSGGEFDKFDDYMLETLDRFFQLVVGEQIDHINGQLFEEMEDEVQN